MRYLATVTFIALLIASAAEHVRAQTFVGHEVLRVVFPEADDQFGSRLVSGDFNGDGDDDLAIGAPAIATDAFENSGAVVIWYGSAAAPQLLSESAAGFFAEPFANFGWSLAAEDLDQDGHDDLIVGAPFKDHFGPGTTTVDTGVLYIYYGSPSGLSFESRTFGTIASGQRFGWAVAAAAERHIFVSAPGHPTGGQVMHLDASRGAGLCGTWSIDQGTSGIPGAPEAGDEFGAALAIANYVAIPELLELWIGAPGEAIGSVDDAGAVWRVDLDLDDTGCAAVPPPIQTALIYHQNSADFPSDTAEAGDRFGEVIVSGDFDGDSSDEVAVSAPGEDLNADGLSDVGCFAVFGDFVETWSPCWFPSNWGLINASGQAFGAALAAGDLSFDGIDDLVVGLPGQFNGAGFAGAVYIQRGAFPGGLRTGPAAPLRFSPEASGSFYSYGSSLAIGRSGAHEGFVAVGEPGADVSVFDRAGRVILHHIREPVFSDGFESGSTSAWSGIVP